MFYSGQNKGRIDYQLINAIQNDEFFKVYYRHKKVCHIHILGLHIVQILFNIEHFL